jgi:hypothetical protein
MLGLAVAVVALAATATPAWATTTPHADGVVLDLKAPSPSISPQQQACDAASKDAAKLF